MFKAMLVKDKFMKFSRIFGVGSGVVRNLILEV